MVLKTHPGQDRSINVVLSLGVARPGISSVHGKYEFNDYISTFTTEVDGKNTNEPELEDEFEENYMTVYVKTISGKTIRIKCDRKQKSRYSIGKIEMRTAITRGKTYHTHQGKVLNDKKTVEESKIEAETTIEMSLKKEEKKEKATRNE